MTMELTVSRWVDRPLPAPADLPERRIDLAGGRVTIGTSRPDGRSLRARGRFMHDALSFSFEDAIARHGGQASTARANFNALSTANKNRVLTFLSSL